MKTKLKNHLSLLSNNVFDLNSKNPIQIFNRIFLFFEISKIANKN